LEKLKEDLASHEHELKHYNHLLKALKLHNIDELENFSGTQESEEAVIPLKQYDSDDMTGVNLESVKKDIHKLEEKLKAQTPNLTAIQNYRELQVKFMERVNELEQITSQRDELCTKFEDVRKKRLDEFMGGFTSIRLKLKEIYRTVTLEGDAELELVDSLDPFTEGIVLSVRPPKKSWKNVSNLSGGEKTLSSLSLVFALHEFRATPIYVMDEIDAALDFKNVSIIAHYIKERTKNAQFIIISLRNNMFELCDRLFGIYKVKNCTSATFIAPELLELDEKKRTFKNITNSDTKASASNNMVATENASIKKQTEENNENDENNRTLTNIEPQNDQ
jgi:structural maintenance of chromosome 4